MSVLEIVLYSVIGITAVVITTKSIIKIVQIKKGTYKPKEKKRKHEEIEEQEHE